MMGWLASGEVRDTPSFRDVLRETRKGGFDQFRDGDA